MSLLKVARLGHPVLTRKASLLTEDDLASARIQRLMDDMIETMRDERGVGLAAPQVHESVRLFVMDPGAIGKDDRGEGLRVLANPELRFPGSSRVNLWEGCLSVPGIRGRTERFSEVEVRWLDRNGQKCEILFRGFPAAVVQHETDHLDGILFFARMPDLSMLAFEDEHARFHAEIDPEDEAAPEVDTP
jgi:peptide deformylase